jgi:hypothetical protein
MTIYIEEDKRKIKSPVLLGFVIGAILFIGFNILDREPVKERKQLCVINSNGWSHVYPVNGRNVKIEYEEVE